MDIETLKLIIKHFGTKTQINKIQEEALELSLVLNQMNCPTKDAVQMNNQLYDELADMKIMMRQAEMIFDFERIDKVVERKLAKAKSKILSGEWGEPISQS